MRRFVRFFPGFILFFAIISPSIAIADVEIIGSWISGTSHSEEAGTERALVFTVHAESSSTSDVGSVTYGGQSMTKVVETNYISGWIAYTCAFILDEAGINAASGSSFVVNWNTSPSRTPAFTSVFLQNVNQASLTGATGVGGSVGTTAETPAISTSNGDMAIVAGTCGNIGTYSTINGFTEAIEIAPESADGIAGWLSSSGGDVTPGVSHTSVNRQSVIGFVVNAIQGPPGQASNPSPADGLTEIFIYDDLSWTAGSGASFHNVYFGTSNPPAFQGNQQGTSFDTGKMNGDTTYYWRIDELNSYGTTTGTVWSFTTASVGTYNVMDYGAAGDGSTLDHDAINAAINAANAAGCGTVYFPTGTYKSGSIVMKDNITLELSENATLLATNTADYNSVDYNPWDAYQDWGHSHWKSSLIWGIEVNNVAITGKGLIDGSAMTAGDPADGYGDRVLSFKHCNGIIIEDINIYRGGHFCIITSGCNDITIDNVLMDTNRDGINIDCCNDVNIVNCIVNSPKDDAICMKSSYCLGYKRPTENVTIHKCTVMGHAVGYLLFPPGSDEGWHAGRIKFGTESNGGFKNITITDCNFEYCRGFMLATVDGGDIDNIIIDNIQMTELWCAPIFMRLGDRARGPGPPPPGTYRNVNISNITATFNPTFDGNISSIASGIPGHYIEDVNFINIDVVYPGGGPAEWADIVLPENEAGHPDVFMFGLVTPCYGFYLRHVDGIRFHNCVFDLNSPDERPEFEFIDALDVEFRNFYASIVSPFDGSRVYYGDDVTFESSVLGGVPPYTYTWQSDVDGLLGSGEQIIVSDLGVHKVGDTVQPHTITLTVEDGDSYISRAEIELKVLFNADLEPDGDVDYNDFKVIAKVMADDWLEDVEKTPNGLAGWWKFDEASGNTAYDGSGNDNTATLYNMNESDWVDGKFGSGLNFDGDGNYVDTNSADLDLQKTDTITVSAWIYPRTTLGDTGIIISDYDVFNALGWIVDFASTNTFRATNIDHTKSRKRQSSVLALEQWYHVVAIIYPIDYPDIYVNGQLDNNPFASGDPTTQLYKGSKNVIIGSQSFPGYRYFNGTIDDIRVYNKALTQEEIDGLDVGISRANLNGDDTVNFKDFVILGEEWLQVGY